MSINALRLARAAVLSFAVASPALVGAFADGAAAPIEIDQPTALALEMIDAIQFVGSDAVGNDYYATSKTLSIDFVVAGTPSTVRGGDTTGSGGSSIVTGGTTSST